MIPNLQITRKENRPVFTSSFSREWRPSCPSRFCSYSSSSVLYKAILECVEHLGSIVSPSAFLLQVHWTSSAIVNIKRKLNSTYLQLDILLSRRTIDWKVCTIMEGNNGIDTEIKLHKGTQNNCCKNASFTSALMTSIKKVWELMFASQRKTSLYEHSTSYDSSQML